MKVFSVQYAKDKEKREIEERRRYPLEMRLRENIVGQERAILTVAACMFSFCDNYVFIRECSVTAGRQMLIPLHCHFQQSVEEKMAGTMKSILLCFFFLDLQGLVNACSVL